MTDQKSHRLEVRPLTLKQANAAVDVLHRHHKPVTGHRFSLGAYKAGALVGAIIVGRPVARASDPYSVAEVTRLATDGTRNACSLLYGATARACKAMGFQRIQTYTLESEPGASLRAVAWTRDGVVRANGEGWNNRKGRRSDQPVCAKVRWTKIFKAEKEAPPAAQLPLGGE